MSEAPPARVGPIATLRLSARYEPDDSEQCRHEHDGADVLF
jgi:hypothetical protein